jgi:hypothetical protein
VGDVVRARKDSGHFLSDTARHVLTLALDCFGHVVLATGWLAIR